MTKLVTTTALAALLMSGAALAQTATDPATTQPATPPAAMQPATPPAATTAPAPSATMPSTSAQSTTAPTAQMAGNVQYVPAQTDGQWLISNFMGQTVRGNGDENIGDINDMVVDKDGRVSAAVIGVGGFLGIGEKDVAVPFDSLQVSDERDGRITLTATKEELRNAPEFKTLADTDAERNRTSGTGADSTTAVGTPARPMGAGTSGTGTSQ